LRVLNGAFDQPLNSEEKAAMPFAGGIMQHGYQCGMIWGAALAAGAQAYRILGPGPQAETVAIVAAQRLVESFRDDNGEINCLGITDLDRSSSIWKMIYVFLIKGQTIGCFRMSAKYANTAFNEINTAFAQNQIQAPAAPASCAAMLAQKMGLSGMHTVMASGFAGGIGLSGGACGALGAAIWIFGMNKIRNGVGKVSYKDPGALDVINKFLKCTDYEFECSEIVGRRFENISDHAGYLCEGGCSKIIEVLSVI
jgi:hypothetical protein